MAEYEYHHVNEVIIDAKVVLQIIKHNTDDSRTSPNGLDGYITGYSQSGQTEVTHSFRSLNQDEHEDEDAYFKASAGYQDAMLRRLRDQNQDHILVGFYRKVANFRFMTKADDLVNLMDFQLTNDKINGSTVMIVYDGVRMSNGDFGLRAYRISEPAMTMYAKFQTERKTKKGAKATTPFAVSNLQASGLSMGDMLVEIPISVKSSYLMNCLLLQMENCRMEDIEKETRGSLIGHSATTKNNIQYVAPAYTIANATHLQQQTSLLKDCVEAVNTDTHTFFNSQRNLHNATIKKHQIISQKERENTEAREKGLKPQTIDIAEIEKSVKMPEEHNRLNGMVHAYQANVFAESVKNLSAGTIGKLFLTEKVVDQ